MMIESAKFEEDQGNIAKAKKILEQLDQQIAPGLLRARMARVNFETARGNLELASGLLDQSLQEAISKKDKLGVTFLTIQYARFLQDKLKREEEAHELFKQALNDKENGNKVLYQGYVTMVLRSGLQGQDQIVRDVYGQAIERLEQLKLTDQK
jgi:tetratricopeptide (TPR) repeat protein